MVNLRLIMNGDDIFIHQVSNAYNDSGLKRENDLDEQDNVPLPNVVTLTGSKDQVAEFIKKIPGENIRLKIDIESSDQQGYVSNY